MTARGRTWSLAGGILAGLGASACCLIPLVVVFLGLGGAWLSHVRALEAYQPAFLAAMVAALGYAHWRFHQARRDCEDGACVDGPTPTAAVLLWLATLLALMLAGFPWYSELLFN